MTSLEASAVGRDDGAARLADIARAAVTRLLDRGPVEATYRGDHSRNALLAHGSRRPRHLRTLPGLGAGRV